MLTMLCVVVPSSCVVCCCAPFVEAVAIVVHTFVECFLCIVVRSGVLLLLTWIVEPGLLVAAPLPCKTQTVPIVHL